MSPRILCFVAAGVIGSSAVSAAGQEELPDGSDTFDFGNLASPAQAAPRARLRSTEKRTSSPVPAMPEAWATTNASWTDWNNQSGYGGQAASPPDPLTQALQKAGEEYRKAKGDEAKTKAREKLATLIDERFEADMKRREAEIAKIEQRVEKLKARLEKRRTAKEYLVDVEMQKIEEGGQYQWFGYQGRTYSSDFGVTTPRTDYPEQLRTAPPPK